MKKKLLFGWSAMSLIAASNAFAQTAGTLTFKFTELTQSPGYSGTKHYTAVWIESVSGTTGTFVKTLKGHSTAINETDHVPTWCKASSNGATTNISASCNVTGVAAANLGATLSTFAARGPYTWDGKNAAGTTLLADGTYRVAIEMTWNHGSTGTKVVYFNFTKGPNADHQTPTDPKFSGITLDWVPSGIGITEATLAEKGSVAYPSPSADGLFNIAFKQANSIKVVNALGLTVTERKIEAGATLEQLDLSSQPNGFYYIYVVNTENKTALHKVIVNK